MGATILDSISIKTIDLATTNGKGPTLICSKMIREGTDPDTQVEFVRGTTPVFAPRSVGSWAAYRVREADDSGPIRFVKVSDPSDGL